MTTQTHHILLADDDHSMRYFIKSALEKAGYSVTDVENGEQAWDVLLDKNAPTFSLLLTDIIMPEMDGIELTHKVRQTHPALKIMHMTGFNTMAINMNADNQSSLIMKPFHMNDIIEQIQTLLAN